MFPRVLPCSGGRVGQDPGDEIGERRYIRKVMTMDTEQNRVGFDELRTLASLRSDNGDANENKRWEIWLELKGGDLVGIQTEIVNFITLPFPF